MCVRSSIGKPDAAKSPYYWWWYLQDIFHGVGGLALMGVTFGCMSYVTGRCGAMVDGVLDVLRERGGSTKVRILADVMLSRNVTGVKIFSLEFNSQVTVAFLWALICTFWGSFVSIMSENNYWQHPDRPVADLSCACLNSWDQTPHLAPSGIEYVHSDFNAVFIYPYNYGLVSCLPYDYALEPYCNTSAAAAPSWCSDKWCYVPEACSKEKVASAYYAGMWYSYAACEEAGATFSSRRAY